MDSASFWTRAFGCPRLRCSERGGLFCRAPDDVAIKRELAAAKKDIREGLKAMGALFRNVLASKDSQDAGPSAGEGSSAAVNEGEGDPEQRGGEGSVRPGLSASFSQGLGWERGHQWRSAVWDWWVWFWEALLGLPHAKKQPAEPQLATPPTVAPSTDARSRRKED